MLTRKIFKSLLFWLPAAAIAAAVLTRLIGLIADRYEIDSYPHLLRFAGLWIVLFVLSQVLTIYYVSIATYHSLRLQAPFADVYEAVSVHGLIPRSTSMLYLDREMFSGRLLVARITQDSCRDARVRQRP